MRGFLIFAIVANAAFDGVLLVGNVFPSVQGGQNIDNDSKADCNITIKSQYGWIRSPGFPTKYPRYSRCQYVVERYAPDVCEVKLSIEWFEVTKMTFSNCSADFFELQNGDKRYKLCGEIPPGSKKFVFFPRNSNQLQFKFQSTFHQKRGFAIEVKQLPFSCPRGVNITTTHASMRTPRPCEQEIKGRLGRITFPNIADGDAHAEKCTYKIRRSEARACVVQLDFSSFEVTSSGGCALNHLQLPGGQKLCGVLGGSRNPFPQQCDQSIREPRRSITSPRFPSSFGPNYRCLYKIYRPDPSVCQIEMEFKSFSLGKHNPAGCTSGAYLELPGRNRLCHDLNGKMILKVSEFKDPVLLYFQSDSQSSGKGFDIMMTQIPNTCPGYNVHVPSQFPKSLKRCYQEVSSYSGYFNPPVLHQVPAAYRMLMWCEFVVRRVDPTVCMIRLQVSARKFLTVPCMNNFVQLPNGERMCVSVTERREVQFPKGTDFITLIYYNVDNPEFNLLVDQVSNTCKMQMPVVHRPKSRRWAWKIIPR